MIKINFKDIQKFKRRHFKCYCSVEAETLSVTAWPPEVQFKVPIQIFGLNQIHMTIDTVHYVKQVGTDGLIPHEDIYCHIYELFYFIT